MLSEELLLYPCDEVATITGTKDIHRHDHHPQSKGGWHNKIFRLGNDFTMLYLFLVLFALFFLSDIFFRKTFHLIYGKPIPRNANAKEVREFLMSMMDEAEKQISYEENFEVVVKLSNYILPSLLLALLLIGVAFKTDILLALFVVSILYIYILISQYKITKRYYKE